MPGRPFPRSIGRGLRTAPSHRGWLPKAALALDLLEVWRLKVWYLLDRVDGRIANLDFAMRGIRQKTWC